MATLCPIIFWRIVSLAQTFRAVATDLSLALRGENQPVSLKVSSVPRALHGRKGVLPAVLSMLSTSLFPSGLAPASQPCAPMPLTPKPASAFLTTHLADFCLGSTVFPIGHLPDVASQSSRPERRAVCGSEWRDRGSTSAARGPNGGPTFLSLSHIHLLPPQKNKKRPDFSERFSQFPFSIFPFLNLLYPPQFSPG